MFDVVLRSLQKQQQLCYSSPACGLTLFEEMAHLRFQKINIQSSTGWSEITSVTYTLTLPIVHSNMNCNSPLLTVSKSLIQKLTTAETDQGSLIDMKGRSRIREMAQNHLPERGSWKPSCTFPLVQI